MIRVGSIVFDTTQGLSILSKAFYDNGVVTDVVVVEHGRRPSNRDWYPDTFRITDLDDRKQKATVIEWAMRLDVFFAFETPFVWDIFSYRRMYGKKSVLMPMYECMPKVLPATPDLYLCPSLLDLSYYPPLEWDELDGREIKHRRSIYLPVPVDVPWRQRTRAEVFVHNAGHGGLKGRNGTRELMEAIQMVKSPAKFIIRTQDVDRGDIVSTTKNCIVIGGTLPYDQLYAEGDVFVFPEKFNGLSLPLQEARAAGMLVMATDRFPMNTWLPGEPLISRSGSRTNNVSPRCNDFEESIVDPKDIAAAIDYWYGRDITQYSLEGKRWAEENSWAVLNPKYLEVLEGLVKS